MIGSTGYQIANHFGGKGAGGYESLISGLTQSMKGFVEALNPSMIAEFNRAMMDLAATIGTAIEPVFQNLIPVFQGIAGAILPAMEALAPVFKQLGDTLGSLLSTTLQSVAVVFQGLAPILELLGAAVSTTTQFLGSFVITIATAIQTFFQWLSSLLPIKDAMKNLRDALGIAIARIYLFAAAMAKALGADNFIKNLINNLTPKTGVAHAAQNSSIQNLESIAKDISAAAFIASGGGNPGAETNLGDILKELKLLQEGKSTWTETVNDIKKVLEKILEVLKDPGKFVNDKAKEAGNWINKQWDEFWKK